MIYIAGDAHGEYDNFLDRIYQHQVAAGDTVIVCGDFGFVWDNFYRRRSLSRLGNESFTIAFADGNHEDYATLYSYPTELWNGGKVHRIADNIYHLMRGQLFEIEGKSFFVMGGAYSRDRAMLSKGTGYWEEELPSREEYAAADETLKKCGYRADYVITHDIPTWAITLLGRKPNPGGRELTDYLDGVYRSLDFKRWFAGHYHVDRTVGGNLQILAEEVVRI